MFKNAEFLDSMEIHAQRYVGENMERRNGGAGTGGNFDEGE